MEEEEAELQEAEESIPEKVAYFASSDYLNVMAVCQSCQENMGWASWSGSPDTARHML